MFNPLSLRLCCLAKMAPALTSEVAARARDKLPGYRPSSEAPLVPDSLGQGDRLKQLQRKLSGPLVSLGSIDTLSELYNSHPQVVSTSVLNPWQINGPVNASIMASKGITNHANSTASTSNGPTMSARTSESAPLKPNQTPQTTNGNPKQTKPAIDLSNGIVHENKTSTASSKVVHSNVPDTKPPAPSVKTNNMNKQFLENVARRQKQLEFRASRLLRQLRRLQSRQAISHCKQQLTGLVEHHQNTFKKSKNPADLDFQTELLQSQNAKGMSTAALVSLIHKWQCAQTSSLRQQLSQEDQEPGPRLDEETCSDLDRVSGHLTSNLSHLQGLIDSDATESSSGGESCEEWDYDDDWDSSVARPPVKCRAEWKWAHDRAAVASRWTWLQAQVSDLEYRIRQQYDIYKQIRANKGQVTLGDPPLLGEKDGNAKLKIVEKLAEKNNEISPCHISTVLSNIDKQTNKVNQQLGPLYTPTTHMSPASQSSGVPTPNGFVDDPTKRTEAATVTDLTCQAARCRPVKSCRKRKLLRTAGLYNLTRKAARLSTVQCHCYPQISPCAMCGGRYNNTVQMEAETMPRMEKVALVDTSFHPVLSFNEDISLSTHFASLLKTGDWQQKPPPRNYTMHSDRRPPKFSDRVRKYTRKLKKNTSATILSSAKIRNKYEQKQLNRAPGLMGSPVKVRSTGVKLSRSEMRLKKRKALHFGGGDAKDLDLEIQSLMKDSANPGNLSLKELWLKRRRERVESAYDINNIVIPYSIAASTRVEKLQYKEIITPKWREVSPDARDDKSTAAAAVAPTINTDSSPRVESPTAAHKEACPSPPPPPPEPVSASPEEDQIEDLSDESFRLRHISCEQTEKKRFSTILPLSASQRRSRGAQRTDSFSGVHLTVAAEDPTINSTASPSETPDSTELPEGVPPPDGLDTTVDSPRQRTNSVSSVASARSRSASHSEDRPKPVIVKRPFVPPWPLRDFPLDPQQFEMLAVEPTKNSVVRNVITEPAVTSVSSAPDQPGSSDEAASCGLQEEDPDDPEWTVVSEKPVVTKQPNIVLKLAKR